MKDRHITLRTLGLTLGLASMATIATPALAADSAAIFKQLDINHDGVITPAEWAKAGQKPDQFGYVDANHDDKIDPAELDAALNRRAPPPPGPDAPDPATPPAPAPAN
jgi:hypothetical protein